MTPWITVHLGAGKHAAEKIKKYKLLCAKACDEGLQMLNNGGSSRTVAAFVSKILEDSPLVNAGIGSNLNYDGEVECDASIMDTDGMNCTAVGALCGVSNPVSVAKCLLDDLKGPADKHGRLKPTVLVGAGAQSYARSKGYVIVNLVTEEAKARHDYWRHILSHDEVSDTIGVICRSIDGTTAVAASSGGPICKYPGRLGPAAIPKAGVWVRKEQQDTVAACTSGNGEDLITLSLAFQACTTLSENQFDEKAAFDELFRGPSSQQSLQSESYFGVLAVHTNDDEPIANLSYAHGTPSMIIGFRSNSDTKTRTIYSCLAPHEKYALGGAALSAS